jgi:hypothetical protein
MDILGAFFQLRMEEAMKQTHPRQMRLDGFLLVGSWSNHRDDGLALCE